MLATPALSFYSSSSSAARPYLLPGSRPALADATNVDTRSAVYGSVSKSFVYPTSSARTGCGWGDVESLTDSISAPSYSRHHYVSSIPSPFPVTCKAPPTVSVSLSAASSQRISAERVCPSGAQGKEPDFPDVTSVVPFPSTSSDGDMDVEMLDGTCIPCPGDHPASAGHAPRKRRSAHSSVSSSQGSLGKETKQKRPRKSKRQVAELWWLGVVHRSILRGIEARQSGFPDRPSSRLRDFDATDRMLAERIKKRLAENGCGEGRLPSPVPRILSPSISVPPLDLLVSNSKALRANSAQRLLSSELNPKGNKTRDGTITTCLASKAPPHASLSIISCSPTLSSTSTSDRRHVHFEIVQRPRPAQPLPSIPRRSPSPPPRTGTVSNAQTLTLTMPQLVASLTLAHHEKSRWRLRGRTLKLTEYGKNAGHSLPSVPCQAAPCDNADVIRDRERMRQSSIPERKSPLSSVAYAEG